MIQKIRFPHQAKGVKRNEYQHHYLFIKKYAELASIEVELCPREKNVFCTSKTYFSIEIDGQQALIDYSDHEARAGYQPGIPYFKYHYNRATHGSYEEVFPVGPMLDLPSAAAYRHFFKLIDEDIYTASGDVVINCQRPRLNARERRRHVQQLLRSAYGHMADVSFKLRGQSGFWDKHRRCLVAVCVPGARNNMLDRGHYEQIALGACTISPTIRTALPYGRELIPGVHYLACRDDYADLIELIEWCRANRSRCWKIGREARSLFQSHCTPRKYWQWIGQCMQKAAHTVKTKLP